MIPMFPPLQIDYIDSLETRDINVKKEGPRICAWDNKSVATAIAQDTKTDGSFGMLPISSIQLNIHHICRCILECRSMYFFAHHAYVDVYWPV
jgi:hypothetical protein